MQPPLDPLFVTSRAKELGCRWPVQLHLAEVTGSTNDDAKHAATEGAPEGSVFLAQEQTRGRGRRDHSWSATRGAALLVSVLLRPRIEAQRLPPLSLIAGLALREALVTLGAPAARLRIKWPNDILLDGKKLAGVLVEATLLGSWPSAVIVGVGLNVDKDAFPPELAHVATSLETMGLAGIKREELLVQLLVALGSRVEDYSRRGLLPYLDELRACDAARGRSVLVDGAHGIAEGIDPEGALMVRLTTGRTVRALHVEFLDPSSPRAPS